MTKSVRDNPSIFTNFPTLKTARLTMRQLRPEDAREIFQMRASGRVNQFIARDNMERLEDAEKLVQSVTEKYENQQAIAWAGVLREKGAIIGTCGFNSIEAENQHAEIGGELDVKYWGKGIAQEAVRTIVKFGFEKMHLHTIEAKVSPGNRGAIYILEKLGFEKEAHFSDRLFFDGKYWDMAVYTCFNPNPDPFPKIS